ncbi:MAG: CCA tRNA nucleotidyltransferase [Candidatus Caldarchaeum sp.]|nr:CCA tRNA nucleotidyltransferase [Candidatus Caldarchaeum sp.]
MTDVTELLKTVAEELRPLPETVEKTQDVASRLVGRLETFFGAGRVSVEGSLAKGTMLRGKEEADIFVHFEKTFPVDDACRLVVDKGVEVIRGEGGSFRLRYANHPYVEGFVDGIRVNIVPCYDAEYGKWITPVDRTPYHTRYVKTHLSPDMADEVRLLKAFLMNDGLYGAEVKVKGFSGYVCELLIIRFRSFATLVREASRWKPPVVLDGDAGVFAAPLVLRDPVDIRRNTAAAVSLTALSNFIMKSKLFLKNPSTKFFLEKSSLKGLVDGRSFLGLVLELPKQPPDVLWGELSRTVEGLWRGLEMHGFKVLRGDRWADGQRGVIVFELESNSLPPVALNRGPPVWAETAVDFVEEQFAKDGLLAYPWVSGERLYSLLKRRYTDASETIQMLIETGKAAVSKNLRPYIINAKIYSDPSRLAAELSGDEANFFMEFVRTCPNYVAHYASST